MIDDIFNGINNFFLYLIDTVLSFLFNLLHSIDSYFPAIDIPYLFEKLPSEIIEAFAFLKLDWAFTLIISSLILRFMVGLIPFFRIGG